MNHKFPILLNGFMEDEEIRSILSFVQTSQKTFGDHDWGRVSNDIDMHWSMESEIPEQFYKTIYECSKKYFGDNVVPSYWKWVRYSPKYGVPNIPPHIDLNGCTFTIDLQLSGTFQWELYVEGVPYMMNNGDALLYCGSDQIHWRPPCPTQNVKDNLDMCFIHFVEPTHWYVAKGSDFITSKEVTVPWRERMNELLPKFKCETYTPFHDKHMFPGY